MNLIEKAAKQFDTSVDDWRMIGKAAVHKSVQPSEECEFSGEAIIRGGKFRGGVFKGGKFNNGFFTGGIFEDGFFEGGLFKGGKFQIKNGVVKDGIFEGGIFKKGIFYGGIFKGGIFEGGEFKYGIFKGGKFKGGVFYGGIFNDGIFIDGVFYGGVFHGGNWHRSPVFVKGTQYWVCESDNEHIASGCIRKPVAWWLENVEQCAEENNYTKQQQAEYRQIFEFVAAQMKLHHNTIGKEDNCD